MKTGSRIILREPFDFFYGDPMIKKLDYIFSIGYQGDTAIVDGKNKKLYGRMSAVELAEQGLYKPAVSSAVYSGDKEEQEKILSIYNERTESSCRSIDDLMKIFGIFKISDQIVKVKTV